MLHPKRVCKITMRLRFLVINRHALPILTRERALFPAYSPRKSPRNITSRTPIVIFTATARVQISIIEIIYNAINRIDNQWASRSHFGCANANAAALRRIAAQHSLCVTKSENRCCNLYDV